MKGKSPGNFQAKSPDIPIEDDPYWKVKKNVFTDEHRVGRYLDRFYLFTQRHPQWADDFMEGVPTYYCVLGVYRGATPEVVQLAWQKKMGSSFYPIEVISEAFRVIGNPSLQKEYDEFLTVVEQFTKCMPPFEKNEMIRIHSENINDAKKVDKLLESQTTYAEYWYLYIEGMPDLYEVAGLAKDSDIEAIITECRQDSELSRKIYSLLTDSVFREQYDIMLDLIATKMEPENFLSLEKKKELWRFIGPDMAGKIIQAALTNQGFIDEYFTRSDAIQNTNQDWKDYLPPSKVTFFSVLGLEAGSLPVDKKEAEIIIRNKYRELERTPVVNLAYSVLKNRSLREDYLWLFENDKLVETLRLLLSVENVRRPPGKERVGKGRNLFTA